MSRALVDATLVDYRYRMRLGTRNWSDAKWLRELRAGNPAARVSDPDWPPMYICVRPSRRALRSHVARKAG